MSKEEDGMERDGLEEDGMERDGKRRNQRCITLFKSNVVSLKSNIIMTP